MTVKDVFIRFLLTYVALNIVSLLIKHIGLHIGFVGIFILIGSTLYACDSFAKKNKRYFTDKEKKQVVIGLILINFLIEGIFLGISAMAGTFSLSGTVLVIALGLLVTINPLIIYIFVGFAGIGSMKRYGNNKDEVTLNENKHETQVMQNENRHAEAAMRTLWAMWIFLVLFLLVELYVGYVFGNQIRQTANPRFTLESMRNVLYVMLIITLLLSYFLRKRMLSVENKGASSTISSHATQLDQTPYVRKYSLAIMISLGFSCLIGIYGVILLLAGSNYLHFFIFMAISFISLCYFRPKKVEFNNLVSALQPKEISVYQESSG